MRSVFISMNNELRDSNSDDIQLNDCSILNNNNTIAANSKTDCDTETNGNTISIAIHPYSTKDIILYANMEMEKKNFNEIRLRKQLRLQRKEKFILGLYEKLIQPTTKIQSEINWLRDESNYKCDNDDPTMILFRSLKYN